MKPSLYEVPHVNEFRSLLTHIETTFADHPAFRLKNGDGELYDVSYHTFCHDVNAFGAALRAYCGLQGAHIAIIGENRYHWCVSYLAVTAGTGVAVPLDKELQADDIREILTTAEVQAVITSKKQLSKMRSLSDALCGKKLLICMDEGQDCLSIPELIRQGESLSEQSGLAEPSPAPDDLASILFTSGTTGTQKGVMLTQENICADIRNVRRNVYIGPGDRTLSILPLHHTYECSLGFLCILYSGGTICFCEGLRHLTANLQEYKPTILVAVPLLMENVPVWAHGLNS